MPVSSATTGTAILIEWANQQDRWVRALVGDVLQTRKPLSETQVEHFYDLFRREKELVEGDPVVAPEIPTDTTGADVEQTLILDTLSSVENVNALAAGQEIKFNPRMTVLFGENAAGKTGYVRILKCVAAVRTKEDILPNISAPAPSGGPSASISYRLGENEDAISWHGETGVRPLTRIDVFDACNAAIYVDDELAYHYTPGELALFRHVRAGIESVRERLDKDRQEKLPKRNAFIDRFPRESPLYTRVESLGPSTDLDELSRLSVVKDEEREQLASLRQTVEALTSGTIKDRQELATGERDLYERLQNLVDILDDFDVKKYNEALGELRTAQKELITATENAFAGTEIAGALSDEWRAFVEAGEAYILDIEEPEYPTKDDKCIYCQQQLEAAAIDLIGKYRNFCNNTLRKAVTDQQTALDKLTSSLVHHETEHLREDVEKKRAVMETDVPDALTKGEEALTLAAQLQTAISEVKPIAEGEADDLITGAKKAGKAQLDLLAEEIKKLTKQVADREKALLAESAKLIDVEGRIILEMLFPQIKEHVAAAKWVDKANTHLGRFRATYRSLTEHAKTASTALLNDNFETLFEAERQALHAPKVSLEFPGRRGRTFRKKSLGTEHHLSSVLSEGEQKVIALADFIAEASLRTKPTPMIFDDPVNSLDYRRLEYVVDRLFQLSEDRQIIVFTHNIWFATEILAQFEKSTGKCTYYDVAETADARGIVTQGSHPRWDTYKKTKGRINSLIQEARSASNAEVKAALVESAYGYIRNISETIVEQELLKGVAQRYTPHVAMTMLPQIRADRLARAISRILPIFQKACRNIKGHSQPLESLSVRPSLTELEQDWSDLQAARNSYLAD